MDEQLVRAQLIEVLTSIQRDSGHATDSITGATCPAKDLGGFDSKIWPVATSMLAQATGATIPNRAKLFVSANGKQHLTVDQIAAEVCRLASSVQVSV